MKIKISTRLVLIFDDYVLKIPLSLRGHLQCINEQYLWNKYKETGLLGEFISYKNGIVKMKKYKPAKEINFTEVTNVKLKISELNFIYCDLLNYRNWGIDDNGKHILIDYGINEEIAKMYNF